MNGASVPLRKILHLDLDAFFCAVEEQRDSTLRGKPFAVGGSPKARGVVASCSYAARKFGIHSAMPMAQAVKRYPHLIIVRHRHRAYSAISRQVMAHLRTWTPEVEPISIDEAFLDLSNRPEPPEILARQLQKEIQEKFRLPCSIGAASNKLVAKIATDVGKTMNRTEGPPNAIQVVPPGKEREFLAPLPADALWGVGPKTAARLAERGIHTIGDITRRSEDELGRLFGKHGRDLARRARGIDDRPIVTSRAAKSISREVTFARDVRSETVLRDTLHRLSKSVGKRLRRADRAASTVKLKIRWPDFTTLTRQTTLCEPIQYDEEIISAAEALLDAVWRPGRPVRLLGVGVSGLGEPRRQLSFWDPPPDKGSREAMEKEARLKHAVADLQSRFGDQVVWWGDRIPGREDEA